MHAVGQLARARPENARYDGPAVAERAPHYHFRLAALDVPRLELGEAAKAEAVWAAVRPHDVPRRCRFDQCGANADCFSAAQFL
jgi:phosphatidylethanolamine-binding protein (PEBP) family uncharacterized protein